MIIIDEISFMNRYYTCYYYYNNEELRFYRFNSSSINLMFKKHLLPTFDFHNELEFVFATIMR